MRKNRVKLCLVLAFVMGTELGCALPLLLTSQATQAQETQSSRATTRFVLLCGPLRISARSAVK
jgi:hypothetical protein